MLAIRVAGLDFPNPVGLAAGFDKDAEVFRQMLGFGFGFVEVGTLTPRPQAGNDRPRLFRLAEDRAVINRMGFNNQGQAAARTRLRGATGAAGWSGVNIGANKDSADRIADYAAGVRAMRGVADYLTVNVSSPNTPGLRALQDKGALDALLAAVIEARGPGRRSGREGPRLSTPPLFLKVAPDLEPQDDRRHRRGGDRPAGRRADRRQHHDQPAGAALEASRRGRRPVRRAAEGAGARAAARFPPGDRRRAAADRGRRDRERRRRLRPHPRRGEPRPALYGPGLSGAGAGRGDRPRAQAAARAPRLRALDGRGRD